MLLKVKKNLFIGLHPFQINKINDNLFFEQSAAIKLERKDTLLKFDQKFSPIHNRNIIKVLHGTRAFWVFQDYFEVI
jgi:hypothetical protein